MGAAEQVATQKKKADNRAEAVLTQHPLTYICSSCRMIFLAVVHLKIPQKLNRSRAVSIPLQLFGVLVFFPWITYQIRLWCYDILHAHIDTPFHIVIQQ